MTKISKNKPKFAAIALVLLMASIVITLYIPVQAQELEPQPSGSVPLPAGVTPDFTVETNAYISFRPNPVGVGQTILVNMWITPATHRSRYLSDYKVTITDPDGNADVITMDSYHADTTAWFEYVVDQIGTWTLKFECPGSYYPAGIYVDPRTGNNVTFPESCYYKPCSDGPHDLVVQDELVLSWPPSPLPTDYWTRPVPVEHREWVSIMGDFPWYGPGGGPDWPADTNIYTCPDYDFVPYVQGPNSAHIVWKRQGEISGLVGATMKQISLYVRPPRPNIIYAGRAYEALTKVVDGEPTDVWQCYDIRTGEVFWEITGVTREPTVIEYTERTSYSVPGEEARLRGLGVELLYVGGGRLIKYDPWTGAVNLDVSIAPLSSGTYYMNHYVLSTQRVGSQYYLINWTTIGDTDDFTERIISNVTWPWSNLGDSQDYGSMIAFDVSAISPPSMGAWYGLNARAANLKTGVELWEKTVSTTEPYFSSSTAVADHGKGAVCMRDGYWHCWDLFTGDLEWISERTDAPWGIWWTYTVASAYGMIYCPSYAGVYAFDWDTGKIAWNYKYPTPYEYETPYMGEYSFRGSQIVADGKVYTSNTEHSESQPITRGWKLHCINATTGEGIWNIMTPGTPDAIADGYLAVDNRYDGYLYVFGKGKSATTVSASPKIIADGDSVMIEGTVLDQSPAQPGTPCVSKESMGPWMEHLHKQMPIPADVVGVPVSLDTLDPNGNFVHIADVTSDMSGMFKKMWTPEVPGEYTIMATFMGDDSYGSSYAETAVGVVEAPEPPPEPVTPATEPEVQENIDRAINNLMPILYGTIVAVVAVAILVVYDIFFRKRQ